MLQKSLFLNLFLLAGLLTGCHKPAQVDTPTEAMAKDTAFYAKAGREVQVEFRATFISSFTDLESFQSDLDFNSNWLENSMIPRALLFLQGPLANRSMGARKNETIRIIPESVKMTPDGLMAIDYIYTGTWLLEHRFKYSFLMPVPYNNELLQTPNWKKCTTPHKEQQTEVFYWYYWDPARPGCDQKAGPHFQQIVVRIVKENKSTKYSHPEYKRMINSGGQKNNLQMTFAFGYVKHLPNPDPFKDEDFNMGNFRKFIEHLRYMSKVLNLTETPIYQSEYPQAVNPESRIGSRFVGIRNGIRMEIKVVAAGDLDQMEIFAKSFAHDHDAFFAWMGHARVGSESDFSNFKTIVETDPEYYSISPDYQVVYWDGCTTYDFYTEPFFEMKAALDPFADPMGTKGLDIVSNGFSTPFRPMGDNAKTWLFALVNWELNFSYQFLISEIEKTATDLNTKVFVNVIGDEDNHK